MSDDKINFSMSAEALYFDIDDRKIYDPTMMGISDLRSKKPGEGDEKKSKEKSDGATPPLPNKPKPAFGDKKEAPSFKKPENKGK
jgi:hypothetical protein